MKIVFLAYGLIVLLFIAFLSVLSYGYGAGYVYIYWRELQIQTNIWVILFFTILTSLFIQLIWLFCKRYFTKEKRKAETIVNFQNLHPYEQLAVISLLDAEKDQKNFICEIFSNSALLKGVVNARIHFMLGNYSQALIELNEINNMAFELAEIQRIEIYLAQQDSMNALTHLEFLNQHELSPWLNDVKNAYSERITELWGDFAITFPWEYLKSTRYGHLNEEQKNIWLKKLLEQFDQASLENIEQLKQRYLDLFLQINDKSYAVKVLWLKLLTRMPDMGEYHEKLALNLLSEQFDQDVFYLWFQQQLLKQTPDYIRVENQINQWGAKYPALPIISFVKWHIYQATGRFEEADNLLDLYPNHVLMDYLRIKSKLSGDDHLIQQLNGIFENNANYIALKI